MPEFIPLISEEEINTRVQKTGEEISKDYKDLELEPRKVEIDVSYSCFSLEKGFIVGYGLDYNEKYRNLPAIYDLKL